MSRSVGDGGRPRSSGSEVEPLPVEPWQLREPVLDVDALPRTESLFALSNGHLGLRGTVDEGEPSGLPGTYLSGVYENTPLPHPEGGYGFPESGESLVNVTNGKLLRLLVDDEPLDVRTGRLRSHERVLDWRRGVLDRHVEWTSPTGRSVRVLATRLVSFTHRTVAAICYEVEPLDAPARVVVQSELVANEQLPPLGHPPVIAEALREPLRPVMSGARGLSAELLHRTKRSGIDVAAGMDHEVEAPGGVDVAATADADWARVTVVTRLEPGQRLRLVKFVAYAASRERSRTALRDQVAAALAGARHTGWQGLLDEQRAYLDAYWCQADVEVDGDPELQQAVRFGLFHVLQSGARTEGGPIPAKGLTGPGYDGHCFWDTEMFVLPVLTHTLPDAAEDALRWRHATLPAARARARHLHRGGAAFPWRTISGKECSGYWPASTAAFHVNADIADAVIRYVSATGDRQFEREAGVELLVETARLWRSLGYDDPDGGFRIDGVTGPDEYSAIADNNVYTNLMAQRNLRAAAGAVQRHPAVAAELGVREQEVGAWLRAAEAVVVPYDERLGVHPQSEGFTRHEPWDFDSTSPDQYPLMVHFPYFDLYRRQVLKQADLVLAMQLRGDAFTPDQKRRNVDYYEPLTVRDSSLSACTQSVLAAEVGYLDLAYDYAREAALMDLRDLHRTTRDGVHVGAVAGAWIALVAGLAGMRDSSEELRFAPRLPPDLERLAFSVVRQGCVLRVEARRGEAAYELVRGDGPLRVRHHDERLLLRPGQPQTCPIPPRTPLPGPPQPPGRPPASRRGTGRAQES